MAKEFYNNLINYMASNNLNDAHSLLMKEVGKSLVKNKSNFVELLTSSGIPASESMSDVELVDSFVNNLPSNKSLMIGTSYMINSDNKFVNADGSDLVSDKGVKVCYRVIYDYFNGDENAENSSNAVGAIAAGVGALANLGSAGVAASQRKKYGATDTLSKQTESRRQLLSSIMAQKQAELDASAKKAETKAKTKRIILIGGIVLVTIVIGVIAYKKFRR